MNNYVDIPVPVAKPAFDAVPGFEPLQWAKKNCKSYITNDAVQKNGIYYYRFFFSNQKDVTMFTLRWS